MNHRAKNHRAVSFLLLLLVPMLCVGMFVLALSRGFAESPESPKSADAPILKLDTGGHMAMINKIIVMADGKRLISASDDKTIRIWDTSTGQETAKILGQIGGGNEGMIYAIALAPDESLSPSVPVGEWLAVGGFLNNEGNKEWGNIRIYDLKTGALIKVLKSHEDGVVDLSVSSDGRYLVSGSADKTVRVWDIADNFSLAHTFKGHTNSVYAVRIFQIPPNPPFPKGVTQIPPNPPLQKGGLKDGDYKIVSAGLDNKAILWSLRDKRMLNSWTHTNKLQFLAVSEEYIAVSGFGNKINIFDHNLKHIKELESETEPAGLSFSPDGRLLLAGRGSTPNHCNIYDSQAGFRKITSFNKHDNLTMATAFLNNRTAVTGGGANNDIYIWDAYTGEVQRQITGNGKSIWSVGIRGLPSNTSIGGREIAFGNTWLGGDTHTNTIKLEKTINLETYTVNELIQIPPNPPSPIKPFEDKFPKGVTQSEGFKRIDTEYQGYSLTHAPGGQYGQEDAVLLIKKGLIFGSVTARIRRGETDGYRHNTYGWTGDGHIISGGMNGHLIAYNKQGQKTASFIGHTGEVWGIAIDGDTLVSGSDDQTIKLWNLRELKNLKPPSIDYELLKRTAEVTEKATGKKWTIEDVKKNFDGNDRSSVYMKAPEIKPIVSIFISLDEWVVWNEQGFYNASTKGDQYVGWHVNKGPENSADYYTARQFRKYLYRPDVIKNTLKSGSGDLAV